MDITLTLNAEEDRVLRSLLEIALKSAGGPSAQAYVHFIQRLDMARLEAMTPKPAPEVVEIAKPANDAPEAAMAA